MKCFADPFDISSVFLENHDHPRVISRFGNDSEKWRNKSAKLFAILQISQSGTQFIFQGQELGLKNFPGDWGIEEYKDVASQNYWNRFVPPSRYCFFLDNRGNLF